ncbi:MAG: hypothetical protein KJ852_01185 [Gammaproteobacteria bacterium]|nr:hypothetical protein [Gammaproteobacteria bacterium]MBU0788166.1 hypothetical protein [Gammaproteobacteria bacterium]MBU0815337.1 hypothetical protein [Gammaproteobacteria bacterium]MBU1785555.1 hypothetical protein [Gammaproteobacteria bacterium]
MAPEAGDEATAVAPQQAAKPKSRLDAIQRRALLSALLVLAIGLGMAALLLTAGYMSYRYGEPRVVSTVPAGRVLGVQLHVGLFSFGLVETDTGFYALEEGVSFLKGEMLTLVERENRNRFLCDSGQHCTRLLRPMEQGGAQTMTSTSSP